MASKKHKITNERIRSLVNERLSQKGVTISSIGHIANTEGDTENQEFRDMPIWHTKQDINRAVAGQLSVGESNHVGSTEMRQIHTAVASVINDLRKSGVLRDWNGLVETGVWRLESTHDRGLRYAGSGPNDFLMVVGKKDEERFRIFSTGEDRARMDGIAELHGAERVWALLGKRTPDATWSRIRRGDRVFFARHGMPFSHLGTVSRTLVDQSLPSRLWGETLRVRQLDRLVLFSTVQEISKQFGETCRRAGVMPGPYTTIYAAEKQIYDPVKLDYSLPSVTSVGIVVLEGGADCTITLEANTAGPPIKITEATTRFLRDTVKVRQLKSKYRGRCQICGYVLQMPDSRTYSEVHHIHPLKDGGDDDYGNMLNLCAKHHVEFDYLMIGISEDCRTVIDRHGNGIGTITFNSDHALARKNALFHLRSMGMK